MLGEPHHMKTGLQPSIRTLSLSSWRLPNFTCWIFSELLQLWDQSSAHCATSKSTLWCGFFCKQSKSETFARCKMCLVSRQQQGEEDQRLRILWLGATVNPSKLVQPHSLLYLQYHQNDILYNGLLKALQLANVWKCTPRAISFRDFPLQLGSTHPAINCAGEIFGLFNTHWMQLVQRYTKQIQNKYKKNTKQIQNKYKTNTKLI